MVIFWIMVFVLRNAHHKNTGLPKLGLAFGRVPFALVILVKVFANLADRWTICLFSTLIKNAKLTVLKDIILMLMALASPKHALIVVISAIIMECVFDANKG